AAYNPAVAFFPQNSTRNIARRIIAAAVLVIVIGTVALLVVHRAIQQVPEFYRRALAAPTSGQYEQGQRFEEHALAMHNQLQHASRWEARFTQEERNGWLAAEMPAKFPRELTPGVS